MELSLSDEFPPLAVPANWDDAASVN